MIFSGATGLSGRVVEQCLLLYIVVICVFFLALITFLMVYFVIRYRQGETPCTCGYRREHLAGDHVDRRSNPSGPDACSIMD